jgi:hypothetical protein
MVFLTSIFQTLQVSCPRAVHLVYGTMKIAVQLVQSLAVLAAGYLEVYRLDTPHRQSEDH